MCFKNLLSFFKKPKAASRDAVSIANAMVMGSQKGKGKVKDVSGQGAPTKVYKCSDCEGSNQSSTVYTVTNSLSGCFKGVGDMVEGLFNDDESTCELTSCSCSDS